MPVIFPADECNVYLVWGVNLTVFYNILYFTALLQKTSGANFRVGHRNQISCHVFMQISHG